MTTLSERCRNLRDTITPESDDDMEELNASKTGTVAAKTPVQVARRNARERNRVRQVNLGFVTLRNHIPLLAVSGGGVTSHAKQKKLSKVETLRKAAEYIRILQNVLETNNHADDDDIVSSSTSSVGGRGQHHYSVQPRSAENLDPYHHHQTSLPPGADAGYYEDAGRLGQWAPTKVEPDGDNSDEVGGGAADSSFATTNEDTSFDHQMHQPYYSVVGSSQHPHYSYQQMQAHHPTLAYSDFDAPFGSLGMGIH